MTKEERKEYSRKWYLKNREKRLEYDREYYKASIDRIKKYREDNKDRITSRRKDYYNKNRDRILNYQKDYNKTVDGLFTMSYGNQREKSKRMCRPIPNYTKQQLQNEFEDTDHFRGLWDRWVRENYNKRFKPSFDRIDPSKPYTLFNLQVMTWGDNDKKGAKERSKPVIQYDSKGKCVRDYESVAQASKLTGVCRSSIVKSCKSEKKITGRFIWKFKLK